MVRASKSKPQVDWSVLLIQALLVVYILADLPLPSALARLGRTPLGITIAALLALLTFPFFGPVTGILSLLAAYVYFGKVLADRSHGAVEVDKGRIDQDLAEGEKDPSLEEEMVSSMAPPLPVVDHHTASYVPALSAQNGLGSPLT